MVQNKLKRIIIAAILGCAVLFIWGGLSHLVIFIGTGFKPLPNEDKVIETLKKSIPEQGLYFFPGKDFRHNTAEQELIWNKKFQFGPTGLLIYKPVGGNPFSPDKLVLQLISNLLSACIIAFITSLLLANYWKKVFVITLLGSLSSVAVSMIYWNWYEFPTSFFIAQFMDTTVGFFLAGLVIAKIVSKSVYITDY